MRHKVQRGFSLITAIFLLVVLSLLGAMMVTFFTAQQQGSALDVLGSRAYQAARAGIEWGAFQITQSGVAGGTFASDCQSGPTSSQVALPGALSEFSVNVWCSPAAQNYDISAVAETQGATPGQSGYVERIMQATISGVDAASGIIYLRESY